jgi:hypothetical protein
MRLDLGAVEANLQSVDTQHSLLQENKGLSSFVSPGGTAVES